jgi:hypothetical protein
MTDDMKRHFSLLALLFALVLNVRSAQGQQLTVQNESGKQIVLSRGDIEDLTHVQATAGTSSDPITYEGVTLKSVLEKAGVSFGESLKGKRLGFCLMVQAADGYRVVIALPELDPAFTDKANSARLPAQRETAGRERRPVSRRDTRRKKDGPLDKTGHLIKNRGRALTRSVLLNHDFGGLDYSADRVALLELQFVGAAAGDCTFDQIVAYPHHHVGHDIAQQNFFDFSAQFISS